MLTVKEMYEMTNEVPRAEYDGFPCCDVCRQMESDTVIVFDGDISGFCSYKCFDKWAVDEYASQIDHAYTQFKENKRTKQ